MKNPTTRTLPIKKVALYKHGMGYFERSGEVEGNSQVELSCSLDEIDDMLKSLLVLKEGGGATSITYDSSKPTSEKLAEFGFDLKKTRSYMDLVGQLKGTGVLVKSADQEIKGRVIGSDISEVRTGDAVSHENFLLLFSDEGQLRRINVAEIRSLVLEDKKLAREIDQQLDLMYLSVSKKDRKNLLVNLDDTGNGQVTIAYSIPTPIWKTSYRLVFRPDENLLLQGVAIVDNVQDEDWEDVSMTLVSAHPISFIQPLYEPVKPRRKRMQAQGVSASDPFVAERARAESVLGVAPMAAAPGQAMGGAAFLDGASGAWGAAEAPPQAPVPAQRAEPQPLALDSLSPMELDIEAQETGELFEYRIDNPVSIPRDSSSLIPIVQTLVEGERVSLFSESRNKEFPYAAVKFLNSTGLTLEAGPVTVFEEETYAGECLVDVVKPDDKRILPYALDKSVPILVQENYRDKPVYKAQASGGILYVFSKKESNAEYKLENLADRKKIVYIEHPVRQGWKLSDSTEKPEESTRNFYRFRVELDGKENKSLSVKSESMVSQQVNLAVMRRVDDYFSWLVSLNYLNKEFLEFLKRVGAILNEIETLTAGQAAITAEIKSHEQDQERARQNVKTLGASATRFQKAIEDSEDKIVELKGSLEKINQQLREKFNLLRVESNQKLESEIKQLG